MTAVVRKIDIAIHYPGGRAAFETNHLLSNEDDTLYAIFTMSGGELGERIDEIHSRGFDADRFVAIGDFWHGPIKEVIGIRFYVEEWGTIPATWHVTSETEFGHA
jgi:hypothetical protein